MSRLTIRRTHQLVLVVGLILCIAGGGDAIESASQNLSDTGRLIVGIGSWALWAATLITALVRLPATLVGLRLGATAGLVALVIATIVADLDAPSAMWALTPALVVVAAALSPFVGEAWIDGASYGDEMRFSLRVPLALAVTGVPIGWLLFVGGILTGPILLANDRWISGGIALVVGVYVALIAARAMNGLARRWLVMVPAGLVLHDHLATREPFLMIRATIANVGPAAPDARLDAERVLDATGDSPGAVIEIDLTNVVECVPRPERGKPAEVERVKTIYVVPTRPLAFVEAASDRSLGGR